MLLFASRSPRNFLQKCIAMKMMTTRMQGVENSFHFPASPFRWSTVAVEQRQHSIVNEHRRLAHGRRMRQSFAQPVASSEIATIRIDSAWSLPCSHFSFDWVVDEFALVTI